MRGNQFEDWNNEFIENYGRYGIQENIDKNRIHSPQLKGNNDNTYFEETKEIKNKYGSLEFNNKKNANILYQKSYHNINNDNINTDMKYNSPESYLRNNNNDNYRRRKYNYNKDNNEVIRRPQSYDYLGKKKNNNYSNNNNFIGKNNYTNQNDYNREKTDFTGYFVNKIIYEPNKRNNINEINKNQIINNKNLNYDYNKRNNNNNDEDNYFIKKNQVNVNNFRRSNIKSNNNNFNNNNWNNNALIIKNNYQNNHFNRDNNFNRNNNNRENNNINNNNIKINNFLTNNRNNLINQNYPFNNNNFSKNNNNFNSNNNYNFNRNNNNIGFQNFGNNYNNNLMNPNFSNYNLMNNNPQNNYGVFNNNLNKNFNNYNQNIPNFNNFLNMNKNISQNNYDQFHQRNNSFNNIRNNQNNPAHRRNFSSPQIRPDPVFISKRHANGLDNVGATCYMNATLQCLAHIEELTKDLLKNKKVNLLSSNKYKYKLSYAFMEVLQNLWQNNSITSYSPNHFKDVISRMNPLFAGVQANDSKDLVLFLMETMHNELNTAKINYIQSQNYNQYNYEQTFNLFAKYFSNNYQSVISNLFYGMYNSMMTCYNCNLTTHNVQCFNILIFPLEEVRKFKNSYYNSVDIIDCFQYYQKNDLMIGDNQIYCNNCHRMANSCNSSKLIIAPNVLVINLNRGKGLQFDVKLTFQEYLNIRNFVYYKDSPSYYKLIGIVTHFGPSSMGGHFIAFCKSFVDNNWYKYNDSLVHNSSFQEASTTGVPYILFYSVVKN